ncbi:MAG: helicase [Sphingomonadales bacterium]|jgi:ATP-dependent RNA helicase SUPV3L1/SUV3|nr:helicase [Sphingomonadales bacterium]MBK9003171.1 helicase [Sphingomonadales bacterium]MBK9268419.1 helicase [Sphingomonadales bacterium]
MSSPKASVKAVLGPTNTGKTHLAVERLCAHSSGVMGFPLRLLAREIYDRVVAIKGPKEVALITGEERIEPPGARWYLCTAESMPVQRQFAFAALDEAQLGADPERGHIFTDRMLHVRGREETMILGSEALRPMVRALLPDAEIISRPRFSTLSYSGPKKLSRLPPRSAIVAFSVEQVYAVAELLRRLRGGAAVVMGALSPRTRNAQVEMFQSGEVDYLVATDAIGMGLNLDVQHIAFAGLSKFDGNRTRRLTVAEMAQIAGRAGRHQRDGTFGTVAGEAGEMTAEEVLAIESHNFPALDWMFWREAEPRFDSLSQLIADLESKPDGPPLRAAPEAIDLAVLKRLADMPEVTRQLTGRASVARLWEVASLPDFRQTGAEHHSRFVASLWDHMAQGGPLPHRFIAGELARLDNIQGDVDAISARIAAARTWSYVAHRADWVEDPPAMAERARHLEEKLSDALHNALRQRFVDRRTTMLMRKGGRDDSLLPVHVDAENQVFVDGEHIGELDGFAFRVDSTARVGERKLLLAAAERHLAAYLKDKARALAMAETEEFSLGRDQEGRPALLWQGAVLGYLARGRSLLQPQFKPARAVAGLEGDDLRAISERAESWIQEQLAKHMGGLVALNQLAADAATDGVVRALAARLADAGGIAGRQFLADTLTALPKEARGAARKAGIVFGALDVYHHAVLKPAAARWRAALFSAQTEKPMPDLPPESAVHLKDWNFASAADCRNAGYRRVGNEYVRIDLAERVIKKAHEARGQAMEFGMDMAFATSLGLGEEGLQALMRDAGFRRIEGLSAQTDAAVAESATAGDSVAEAQAVPEEMVQAETEAPAAETEAVAEGVADDVPVAAPEPAEVVEENAVPAEAVAPAAGSEQPANLTYWRWIGIRKAKPAPRPARTQERHPKKGGKPVQSRPAAAAPAKPKNEAPSALALQLAALKEKMGG